MWRSVLILRGYTTCGTAICEEFGERSLGPELDPGVLDVSLTIEAAAAAMASLLGARGDHGG